MHLPVLKGTAGASVRPLPAEQAKKRQANTKLGHRVSSFIRRMKTHSYCLGGRTGKK